MRPRLAALAPLVLLLLSACDRPAPAPEPAAAAPEPAVPLPAPVVSSPEFLEAPFTAEEIRDEWIPGFTLEMQMSSPQGDELQRWTVVGADAEGVDIEYAALDPVGNVVGAPKVRHAGWTELRDHASFPASRATRQEVTRSTPLGELDGWLYTVRGEGDPEQVTEFFFARSLPGAPVEMTVTKGGEVVSGLAQIRRQRPE